MSREGLGSRRTAATAGCRMPWPRKKVWAIADALCAERLVPDFQ
jgi:hypothetical protein